MQNNIFETQSTTAMKTQYFDKFLIMILAMITGFVVTSCDGDEMTNEADKAKYEKVVKQLITSDGLQRFPECEGSHIRYLACESEEVAKGIASALTLGNISENGKSTLNLHEYGKIEVTKCNSSGNEFFLVSVNLKELDSFQLHLVSIPYLIYLFPPENGDEADALTYGYAYKCPECGFCYMYLPTECPNCGAAVKHEPLIAIIAIPALLIDDVGIKFEL